MKNWSNIIPNSHPSKGLILAKIFPQESPPAAGFLWLCKVTGESQVVKCCHCGRLSSPKPKPFCQTQKLHLWFLCLVNLWTGSSCTCRPIYEFRFGAVLPWNKHPQNRNRVAVRVLMQIYWLTYVSVILKISQDSDRKSPEHLAVRQLGPHYLQLGQLCTGGTFQIHSQQLLLVTFLGWSV